MTNSLHFHSSDEYQQIASKENDLMIISDKKESFTAGFTSLAATAGITNPTDIAFLTSVAEIRLTASADSTSSVELFIQGLVATDPPRRIVFALLPSNFGRHNTPSRSHSVAALIKSHKGSKKDFTVILAPSQGAYHIPQALAAARQFPLFSLQSSINKDKKNAVHIVLYGHKENSTKETLTALANVSEGIQLARELVDSPPNVLNCNEYLSQCIIIANNFRY
jgi:leucyl aminopeptidase